MSVTVDMAQQRVIFGDEVQPGMTVVVECLRSVCGRGTSHAVAPERGVHHLTILRLRTEGCLVVAIAVDEDGNQQPWEAREHEAVRVRS